MYIPSLALFIISFLMCILLIVHWNSRDHTAEHSAAHSAFTEDNKKVQSFPSNAHWNRKFNVVVGATVAALRRSLSPLSFEMERDASESNETEKSCWINKCIQYPTHPAASSQQPKWFLTQCEFNYFNKIFKHIDNQIQFANVLECFLANIVPSSQPFPVHLPMSRVPCSYNNIM